MLKNKTKKQLTQQAYNKQIFKPKIKYEFKGKVKERKKTKNKNEYLQCVQFQTFRPFSHEASSL